MAAQKLVVPLAGGGDLEAADRVEARQAVVLERAEQRDGVLRQPGHRARAAELEDEARGVRGRAARLPERTLVDEHDVGAAELGEVICQTGSGDAAADDDDVGLLRQ